MPSSPSSLAPTTGTTSLASNNPTSFKPRVEITRSTASCETFAVDTTGYMLGFSEMLAGAGRDLPEGGSCHLGLD